MNTLRTILIVVLMVGLTLFAVANNHFVAVNFGVRQVEVWLPLLLLVSFIIGFLPAWAKLGTDRMLLRRRVTKLEANISQLETELALARTNALRPSVVAEEAEYSITVPYTALPPGI